jgi:hypothetical protein
MYKCLDGYDMSLQITVTVGHLNPDLTRARTVTERDTRGIDVAIRGWFVTAKVQ